MRNGTITVRNLAQKVLLEKELLGQFSDGKWENATPRNHWKVFTGCQITVGDKIGCDFPLMRKYNLVDKELLDIIGKRMAAYVRAAKVFGEEAVEVLSSVISTEATIESIDSYGGEYWDEKRQALKKFDMEAVGAVIKDENLYSMKQLRKDLKDLRVAMETRND